MDNNDPIVRERPEGSDQYQLCYACSKNKTKYAIITKYSDGHESPQPYCKDCMKRLIRDWFSLLCQEFEADTFQFGIDIDDKTRLIIQRK